MLISYNIDGSMHSINGFRMAHSPEMINDLQLVPGYANYRIYDADTIERVWKAYDTGGTISVELDDAGDAFGVITANGAKEPPSDVNSGLPSTPSSIERLERENADLWYQNMLLENELTQQKQRMADLEFNLMMGGVI